MTNYVYINIIKREDPCYQSLTEEVSPQVYTYISNAVVLKMLLDI